MDELTKYLEDKTNEKINNPSQANQRYTKAFNEAMGVTSTNNDGFADIHYILNQNTKKNSVQVKQIPKRRKKKTFDTNSLLKRFSAGAVAAAILYFGGVKVGEAIEYNNTYNTEINEVKEEIMGEEFQNSTINGYYFDVNSQVDESKSVINWDTLKSYDDVVLEIYKVYDAYPIEKTSNINKFISQLKIDYPNNAIIQGLSDFSAIGASLGFDLSTDAGYNNLKSEMKERIVIESSKKNIKESSAEEIVNNTGTEEEYNTYLQNLENTYNENHGGGYGR